MQVTEGSHYLAYVLDDECRENLLSRVVTRHEVQVCHHVTIHYKFINEISTAAGLVIVEHNYPQGKGVVIKLMESNNGFNIGGEIGWRYVSLWIPVDRSGMAGFLC